MIIFEGWDAAGKGGIIRRLSSVMDPRAVRVWPISAPDAREREEHYLQRFWRRLPANGELGVFDRSWYGRVLVERVEGFADREAWSRAYDADDYKEVFEHGHDRMGAYVSSMQVAGID